MTMTSTSLASDQKQMLRYLSFWCSVRQIRTNKISLTIHRVVDTVMDKTTIMVIARPIKYSIVGT